MLFLNYNRGKINVVYIIDNKYYFVIELLYGLEIKVNFLEILLEIIKNMSYINKL